jgi:hypothetical protein
VKACILIPSYEWYRVLADFTESQIDCHWRDHPPRGPCEASTLNETLPAILDTLQAGTISLFRADLDWSLEKNLMNGQLANWSDYLTPIGGGIPCIQGCGLCLHCWLC